MGVAVSQISVVASATVTTSPYALLAGGGTANTLQQIAGLGTAGQVLTSNGAGQLPTWQAATGGGTTNASNLTSGTLANARLSTNVILDTGTYSNPAWLTALSGTKITSGTVGVTVGGTGRVTYTAYALIAGGTTSTGTLQQLASNGTAGQVLTSTGATSLPTWQNASGGSSLNGTGFVKANGTTITYDNSTYLLASGNAVSASTLNVTRLINGVGFNGSTDITITAASNTLTGTTLASNVVTSSLTAVGTLVNLTVTNPINGNITGNAQTVTTNANLTGDVTSIGNATSIASNVIVNTDLVNVASQTMKGRITAGTGSVEDLTKSQILTLLNVADGANAYVHPTGDGNMHVPATSTTNNGKVLMAGATAGSFSWQTIGGGTGSVTTVSVVTANGISGSVSNATTTPAITLTLGAITPSTIVASSTISGTQITSTIATGTAPFVVSSTTPVANLSIGGNAATVTTNANLTGPITSVGNATSITNASIDLTTKVTGTLPVGSGGTSRVTYTAYALICGGTTSTGTLQQVSSVGLSGQVLMSNGASALPTWQTITGGTQNLASVTSLGATTTDQISADSFVADGGNGLVAYLGVYPTSPDNGALQLTNVNDNFVASLSISTLTANRDFLLPNVGGTLLVTNGINGTFTTVDSKTITVVDGQVTSIV